VKYCLSVVCFVHIMNGNDFKGNMLIRMKLLKFWMFVLVCDLKKQECEICSSNSTDYKECSPLGC
jgi:hypothetical protein